MANFSNTQKTQIWNKADSVANTDSTKWRKDPCGAWIYFDHYGQETDYGWEIDHVFPVAKGGTDHNENLRATHWRNNRSKSDDFPSYVALVTSDGNKNIDTNLSKTINQNLLNSLKRIYPQSARYSTQ